MKLFYDLHIHSALSPCGDEDMTPNNIANMAVIKGLNVIALTDHNSTKNCAALLKAAQGLPLCVLPGMELCTAEEIHVVCLFDSLQNSDAFQAEVEKHYLPIQNRPDIFGRQLILDEKDEIIGTEEILLTSATDIPVSQVAKMVESFGGFAIPAHINRPSFSLSSVLGTVPEDLGFSLYEVADGEGSDEWRKNYPSITDSDAHYLEHIAEPVRFLEAENATPTAVLQALRKKCEKCS